MCAHVIRLFSHIVSHVSELSNKMVALYHSPESCYTSSLKHCRIISLLVLKVMVTLTMTFALSGIYPSKFEGPSPKHCQVIKLFSSKGPVTLTFALRISYW